MDSGRRQRILESDENHLPRLFPVSESKIFPNVELTSCPMDPVCSMKKIETF
jgi:hypothetical protein